MINLGDKKWGVKDSGLLAYKQVGSKFFNKDFDFARSSDATYIDKNGVLQTQSLYNLLDYSNDFTESEWSKTNATITSNLSDSPQALQNSYKITDDTSTGYHSIRYSNLFVSDGNDRTWSLFVKKGTARYCAISNSVVFSSYVNSLIFDMQDGVYTNEGTTDYFDIVHVPVDMGNGWWRIGFTSNINSGSYDNFNIGISKGATWSGNLSYTGDGSLNFYIYGAQVVEGTEPLDYQYTNGRVGIPRIDFTDANGALLLEPQRTNLFTYSESTNNFSSLGRLNCSYSLGNGYDGFDSSCKITNNTFTNNRVRPVIVFNSVLGESNYFTLRVKKKQGWYLGALSGNGCNFFNLKVDLSSNGGYISSSGTSETNYVVQEFSDYYLIGFITTQNSTTLAGLFNLDFFNNVNFNNYDLTTIEEFNITGIQWENQQTYSTSYIKTEGSTVTRTADVANNCGTEQDFNSEEGVLYAEIKSYATGEGIISISDGSNTNRLLFIRKPDNKYRLYVERTTLQLDLTTTTAFDLDSYHKFAVLYKANDFKLYVDGILELSSTSALPPVGISQLEFYNPSGSSPFYGKVRSVKYFPTALGDSKLITLTGGDGSLYGLFNSFEARVLADGGTIESQDCIINELKELL